MDGLNWLLLPKATKCGRFLSPLAINRFDGDPSIVTNVYNANPPFPPNEDLKTYYDVIMQLETYFFKFFSRKIQIQEIAKIKSHSLI